MDFFLFFFGWWVDGFPRVVTWLVIDFDKLESRVESQNWNDRRSTKNNDDNKDDDNNDDDDIYKRETTAIKGTVKDWGGNDGF